MLWVFGLSESRILGASRSHKAEVNRWLEAEGFFPEGFFPDH